MFDHFLFKKLSNISKNIVNKSLFKSTLRSASAKRSDN